jgi:ABC-type iron transport system FetAB permease component
VNELTQIEAQETVQVPRVQGAVHVPVNTAPSGHITPIPGVVTKLIGSGDHAQNAIVYRTILWSFLLGGIFSAASFLYAAYRGAPSPLSELKEVWSIFGPFITLALGYVFGKGR